MLETFRLQRETLEVAPHTFTEVLGLPITNTLVTAVVVTVFLALVGWYVSRQFKLVPDSFQNALELLQEQMLQLVDQITADRRLSQEIFPLIAALFVYIGVANVLTLVPGIQSVTFGGESLFRTPTSDLNLPLGLALATVAFIQLRVIYEYGLLSYVGRYVKIKELIAGFQRSVKDGFIALVEFFVGLLDVIAEAAKVISLSFRLFGNMFAGELLAVLILGAFAIAVPSLWLSLNLLFALVQALVFGALVAGYYTLAVQPEGDIAEAEEGFEE